MIESITIAPQRRFGPILAHVVVEEEHQDELTLTEHPVETGATGATITDHAFKNPSTVTIRAGWTNSHPAAGGDEAFVTMLYQRLLELQASRIPFDVITGKRLYSHMLFRSLGVTTDQASEAALMMTAVFQEIIIVRTEVALLPSKDVQADPKATAGTSTGGLRQLKLIAA